ncbi:hypothetical protein FAZ95_12485 [Trinickia violacea]|uniref:Uncharacterized protein n=1 Tax=Trinickia violacea TaxID=2571746 RepID=A0A4V1EHD8_9BURK|nr:hypothetical protein [Trinickia violacea]QCP49920.1 hypothetical protein FAZ95_12485 [Trinickia violacea]
MAAITINDLHTKRELDRKAMSLICGAGAPWVFGWIQPFTPPVASVGPVVNFYQTNIFANQLVNQVENINVNNAAPNSNVAVSAGENGKNNSLLT